MATRQKYEIACSLYRWCLRKDYGALYAQATVAKRLGDEMAALAAQSYEGQV